MRSQVGHRSHQSLGFPVREREARVPSFLECVECLDVGRGRVSKLRSSGPGSELWEFPLHIKEERL